MKQKEITKNARTANTASLNAATSYWQRLFALIILLISLGAGQQVLAQAQYDNAIILSQKPTGSSAQTGSYAGKNADAPYSGYTKLGNPSASVPTPQLGTYDLSGNNTSALSITGGVIIAGATRGSASPTGGTMLYRVYLVGTPTNQIPAFSRLPLPDNGTDRFGDNIYQNNTASIDLLKSLTSGGTYTIDVQFEVTLSDNTTLTDPTSSYNLSFFITPPDVTPTGGTTTWQSKASADWFLASNWTNGVPTSTSNAVIPENTQGTNIIFPILNDLSREYVVNNITLQGNTASGKAQLTIQNATLRVYGNIAQITGGLVGAITNRVGVADATQNSTLILAGQDQFITGRLSVPDIIVAGSGIKSVLNIVVPTNTLSFRPDNVNDGVLIRSSAATTNPDGSTSYVFDTTGNSLVNLGNTGLISTVAGDSETNSSYVLGIVNSLRQLDIGINQNFGNIGLELLPNHSATNITVTRTIGDPLIGPTTPRPRVTPVPVKRQYQVTGDDNSSSNGFSGSQNTVTFHYLASDFELNGITETNLTMYRTNTGAAPYTPVDGVLDTNNHVVVRADLPTFSNFYLTLGDKTNPLPVSLAAFTAVRSGADAVLSWTTASEKNNTGFEVQVSTDGATFRKLAFVASQNANSNQKLVYAYNDTEIGKSGVRYYRLRQIDTDGTEAFSPVRAVSFSGAASVATALTGYPNPFTNKLDFNLDATVVGSGVAHVQLVDMTGRVVLEQNLKVANASLTLTDLDGLRSGLYLAKVTLPDGTTQKVRVQKQ